MENAKVRTITLDDLDLKPISNMPHLNFVYLPERPNHPFSKKLRHRPEKLAYVV